MIASLLAAERATAAAIIDEHDAELQALPDFRKLSETAVAQCLEKSVDARATMSSARFVTAIRDRLNRYRAQDYPAQLALVSRLAAPPPPPPKPGGGAPPNPEPPAPTYVPASSLRAKCDLPFIGSEDDLDRWLAALRTVAAEKLKKGNRISLWRYM